MYSSFVSQYEFNNVPFGIACGSMVLTNLADKINSDIKYTFLNNIIDRIYVYTSGSFEEHLSHVLEIITCLQAAVQNTIAANHIQFLEPSQNRAKFIGTHEFAIPENSAPDVISRREWDAKSAQ
ncbi:hypothetical protein J6590_065109 [Homalodisca vitripennis]|nr:hypothetical protein J6590_065109 [Homalodisca vitripennis]